MTGEEIFKRDTAHHSGYGNLLFYFALNIDLDILYNLLEQAEAKGMQLRVNNPTNDPTIFDRDVTAEQIIFVKA